MDKDIQIIVSYRNASTTISVLNMYCNGPQYHHVKKRLYGQKNKYLSLLDRFCDFRRELRIADPDLSIENCDQRGQDKSFLINIKEIYMIIECFELTIEESKYDDYYELKVLAAPIKEVRDSLKFWKRTYSEHTESK